MALESRKTISLSLLAAGLLFATASMAGSEKWMMSVTQNKMDEQGLVHVAFLDKSGDFLESEALKQMEIRVDGCDGTEVYKVAKDYKYGYRPSDKRIGVFLLPKSWQNRDLCFKVPGIGQVRSSFPASSESKSSTLSF